MPDNDTLWWSINIFKTNEINYGDYFKISCGITYNIDSNSESYKILSIVFKWGKDKLSISYNKKDRLLVIFLLIQYKDFLNDENVKIFENAETFNFYSDIKCTKEIDFFAIDENKIDIYFKIKPLGSIICEIDGKEVTELIE